jgi:hypothetical protein
LRARGVMLAADIEATSGARQHGDAAIAAQSDGRTQNIDLQPAWYCTTADSALLYVALNSSGAKTSTFKTKLLPKILNVEYLLLPYTFFFFCHSLEKERKKNDTFFTRMKGACLFFRKKNIYIYIYIYLGVYFPLKMLLH